MDRPQSICIRGALLCALVSMLAPAAASAGDDTGGAKYVPPPPPAKRAKIVNGIAVPPRGAPARVKAAIAAANRIVTKPYVYGGGHRPYSGLAASTRLDRGYDCSGTVSFALYGGGFLTAPLDSSGFMSWGAAGKGRWISVYTNPGHAYMVIGGLRLDTSGGDRVAPQERTSGRGPRWRVYSRSPQGFTARHPNGY